MAALLLQAVQGFTLTHGRLQQALTILPLSNPTANVTAVTSYTVVVTDFSGERLRHRFQLASLNLLRLL